jgi:hypothetical protein
VCGGVSSAAAKATKKMKTLKILMRQFAGEKEDGQLPSPVFTVTDQPMARFARSSISQIKEEKAPIGVKNNHRTVANNWPVVNS